MRKVIDFFQEKRKRQTTLEVLGDIILKNNNLKTIECLCRVSRLYARTPDTYHISAAVHCLESMRQEIDDLIESIRQNQGNANITFDP